MTVLVSKIWRQSICQQYVIIAAAFQLLHISYHFIKPRASAPWAYCCCMLTINGLVVKVLSIDCSKYLGDLIRSTFMQLFVNLSALWTSMLSLFCEENYGQN